jgi:hypothetical protein
MGQAGVGVTLVMGRVHGPPTRSTPTGGGEKRLLLRLQGGVYSPAMFGAAQAGSSQPPITRSSQRPEPRSTETTY